jgi:hypothetical protein
MWGEVDRLFQPLALISELREEAHETSSVAVIESLPGRNARASRGRRHLPRFFYACETAYHNLALFC